MLKHAFSSAKSDGADGTQIQPSNWNADHVIDSGGATMSTRIDAPAAPGAGNVVMFGKTIAGGALPAFIGPSGYSSALQPFLARNKIGLFSPAGNSTTVTSVGFLVNVLGTATARNVATTNLFSSMRRIGYVTATTANSRSMAYGQAQFFLSSTAGLGGFRIVIRAGISDAAYVSACNFFMGLAASSTITSGGTSVASTLNIVGVGADAADSNMQIFYNDGSGTATKIDLGANFPANTANTDMYEIALFAASGGGQSIGYQVTRLNTGDTASGTLTTDIPAANQLLIPIAMRGNLSTGGAVGIDIVSLYQETDN